MNNKDENKNENENVYHTPELLEFGTVDKITQGGKIGVADFPDNSGQGTNSKPV